MYTYLIPINVLILERGLDLIKQKNQMIEILKRDLAESDNRFLQEQAAQCEDVRILQERIENQVKFIRKQYKNHIQYIKVRTKHLKFIGIQGLNLS